MKFEGDLQVLRGREETRLDKENNVVMLNAPQALAISSNMWLTCAVFPGFTQASPSRHKAVRLDTFQSYEHCQPYHHKIRTTKLRGMTCCCGRGWTFERR